MTARKRTDLTVHTWQHLPALGPNWEWCKACQRARRIGTEELVEYSVAAWTAYAAYEKDSDLAEVNR